MQQVFALVVGTVLMFAIFFRVIHHIEKRERAALQQRPTQPNEQFLQTIRSRSCYRVLRDAHWFLTFAAVIATGILWSVLMNAATGGEARIYATFTCGAVIVALLIEYGLFRLIVDAVDVLIDTGRRSAGQPGDAAAGAGG